MRISGQHTVAVPRQSLWDALHDPELLRQALPGCTQLEAVGPQRYRVTLATGISCIAGAYHGDLEVVDRTPPGALTLAVDAAGEPGRGRGTVTLDLDDQDGATAVGYVVDVEVDGAIAKVGQRLLDSAAHRLIVDHLDAVAVALDGAASSAGWEDRAGGDAVAAALSGGGEADGAQTLDPATVTFAPGRVRRDRLVSVAIGAGVAVGAYLLGRRSQR